MLRRYRQSELEHDGGGILKREAIELVGERKKSLRLPEIDERMHTEQRLHHRMEMRSDNLGSGQQ